MIYEGGERSLVCCTQKLQAFHPYGVKIYPAMHQKQKERDINFCQGRFSL